MEVRFQGPRVDHKHSNQSKAHNKFQALMRADFHQPYVVQAATMVDDTICATWINDIADHEVRVTRCIMQTVKNTNQSPFMRNITKAPFCLVIPTFMLYSRETDPSEHV